MNNLDSKSLNIFLKKAAKELVGDWVLLGGTLLPALGVDVRVTTDIDIICLDESTNKQQLVLMELAESMKIPPESINMAAEYFFRKVGHKKEDLIPLVKGPRCVIYRPSVTLYLLLKIARLTESDLLDCESMILYAKKNHEVIDRSRLTAAIKSALQKAASNEGHLQRLEDLRRMIGDS